MKRTQVQLTEKQYKTIKEISSSRNISMAEVIREAIDWYCPNKAIFANKEKIQKAIGIMGKYRSGHQDISKDHDRYLRQDFKR